MSARLTRQDHRPVSQHSSTCSPNTGEEIPRPRRCRRGRRRLISAAGGIAGLVFVAQTALATPVTFSFDLSGSSNSMVSLFNTAGPVPAAALGSFANPGVIDPFVLDLTGGPTMNSFTAFTLSPPVPNPNATGTGDISLDLDIAVNGGAASTVSLSGAYVFSYNNLGGVAASPASSVSALAPTPVMATIDGVTFQIEIVDRNNIPTSGQIEGPIYNIMTKLTLLETPEPELTVSPSPLAFGKVRIGTAGTQTLTVENTGDAGSSLSGAFGGASSPFTPAGSEAFSDLDSGDTANRDYGFTPAAHGAASTNVTVSSNAGDQDVTLEGEGVGPVFDSPMMIDFGTVEIGDMTQEELKISNMTTDMGALELVGLTLLSLEIIGADAIYFDILDDLTGTILDIGDMVMATLKFMPTAMTPDDFEAQLKIVTDQNAPYCGMNMGCVMGDMFLITLKGSSFMQTEPPVDVDEPLPIAMFAFALSMLIFFRRRLMVAGA